MATSRHSLIPSNCRNKQQQQKKSLNSLIHSFIHSFMSSFHCMWIWRFIHHSICLIMEIVDSVIAVGCEKIYGGNKGKLDLYHWLKDFFFFDIITSSQQGNSSKSTIDMTAILLYPQRIQITWTFYPFDNMDNGLVDIKCIIENIKR